MRKKREFGSVETLREADWEPESMAARLDHQRCSVRSKRVISGYLGFVSALLLLTAAVKVAGSFSHPLFLNAPDPLFFFLTRRQVLLCAAVVEIVCAVMIFRRKADVVALWLLAWLSGLFGIYRIAMRILGESDYICPCLGYWLPVKYPIVNRISFGLFLFLCAGSIVGLCLHYRHRRILKEPVTGILFNSSQS